MNILIAADYSAPFGGNFIGSLQDLGLKLRERGDRVVFLFPKTRNGERAWIQWLRNTGYDVVLADLSVSEQDQIAFLREVLEANRIDLIHLHFGIYSRFLWKRPDVFGQRKVLIHDHMGFTTGVNRAKQNVRLAAYSALYAIRGYGLVAVSEKKRESYFFMLKKWHIPNGLSLKRNVDHFSDREQTRIELGIREDQILVLLLGWDMKRKGVDIAVKAVSKLYESGNNVVLGLIGGGVEQYHQFIRQYGVDPNNPYIAVLQGREDIYSLYRATDVFLSASRDEGFSYAILEAISQETPVAMSDIPETAWASNYEKCAIYPTEDENACANAIMRAIAFGRGPSNAEKIVEQFSIERWCDSIIDKYDRLMGKQLP